GGGRRPVGGGGGAKRDQGCQPALALGGHPRHGSLYGRDVQPQGAGRGLRRRQGLRILFLWRPTDHSGRDGVAHQSAGHQIGPSPESITPGPVTPGRSSWPITLGPSPLAHHPWPITPGPSPPGPSRRASNQPAPSPTIRAFMSFTDSLTDP